MPEDDWGDPPVRLYDSLVYAEFFTDRSTYSTLATLIAEGRNQIDQNLLDLVERYAEHCGEPAFRDTSLLPPDYVRRMEATAKAWICTGDGEPECTVEELKTVRQILETAEDAANDYGREQVCRWDADAPPDA